MFTGLIETLGQVVAFDPLVVGTGARLTVDAVWPDRPGEISCAPLVQLGDSIAVNGCCLTAVSAVVQAVGTRLTFDLSHETLRLTAFGTLTRGDEVNCERAARLGDRLGGHLVTGHVDGLGRRLAVIARGGAWDVTYAVPTALEAELVVKGSVAIDGVSLTVNALPPGQLQVTLIPHTVGHTQLLAGDGEKPVHLETDLLAKHVRRLVELGFGPQATVR